MRCHRNQLFVDLRGQPALPNLSLPFIACCQFLQKLLRARRPFTFVLDIGGPHLRGTTWVCQWWSLYMLCCIFPLSLGHRWVPARLPLFARFSLDVSRWLLHKSEDLYLLTYFPVPSGPGPVCYAVEAAVGAFLQPGRNGSRFRGIWGAGLRLSRCFWSLEPWLRCPGFAGTLWTGLAGFSNRLFAFLQLSFCCCYFVGQQVTTYRGVVDTIVLPTSHRSWSQAPWPSFLGGCRRLRPLVWSFVSLV